MGRPKKNINPEVSCLSCGTLFVVPLCKYQSGGGKYCSVQCNADRKISKINENFFSIPSSEMAYVLGLFMSDGYLTKKQSGNLKLCIKVNDRDLLETISRLMEYEGKIYNAGLTQAGNESYKIEISNQKIIEDAQRWGIVERKTLSVKFPKELPREYWNDFIRGLFDGDGCIHLSKDKRRKSSYNKQCSFLGTEDLLNAIPEHLGLENKVFLYKKIAKLVYYKASDLKKIFDAIYYSDNVPCLARKRDKFAETIMAGQNEPVDISSFVRNGKIVEGFSRIRSFEV